MFDFWRKLDPESADRRGCRQKDGFFFGGMVCEAENRPPGKIICRALLLPFWEARRPASQRFPGKSDFALRVPRGLSVDFFIKTLPLCSPSAKRAQRRLKCEPFLQTMLLNRESRTFTNNVVNLEESAACCQYWGREKADFLQTMLLNGES